MPFIYLIRYCFCVIKCSIGCRLGGSRRSVRKMLRIGSMLIPASYRRRRCLPSHTPLNWMSCTPLWSRKKRNLHPKHCGSRHSLLIELGCGANQKQWSYAGVSGTCSASQTILLRCLCALWYALLWSTLWVRTDKKETYSVEAVNADLRHYLKRLARKSRCFSRRLDALSRNIRLFVYCYNQRQLMQRLYPKYSFHLIEFLCPVS